MRCAAGETATLLRALDMDECLPPGLAASGAAGTKARPLPPPLPRKLLRRGSAALQTLVDMVGRSRQASRLFAFTEAAHQRAALHRTVMLHRALALHWRCRDHGKAVDDLCRRPLVVCGTGLPEDIVLSAVATLVEVCVMLSLALVSPRSTEALP